MPKVSWHLLSYSVLLLLFVLLTCCGSQAAGSAPGTAVNLFTGTTPITCAKWEEMQCVEGSVRSLRVPSLVEVDGAVFAVAEAHCKNGSGSFSGIVSQHLKRIGTEPTEIPMGAGRGSFHTQLLKEGGNEMRDTSRPTTIVSGNNVYVLLRSCSRATPETREADQSGCKIVLVKGSVTEGEEKKVQWNETHAMYPQSRVRGSFTYFSAGGGSGTVMSDGAVVFPVQATKDGRNVLLILRFTPFLNRWGPVVDTVGEGCHNPSIVEWGEVDDRRIFVMAPCTDGSYHVHKSLISLYYWSDGEPISQVWGNSRDRKGEGARSGFISATIDGMKLMLLSTPVYSEEKGEGQAASLDDRQCPCARRWAGVSRR
ncbi:trans-sialidase [Trypanosoma rangeli]|uniref:Trans-sialidase n=1 Tax=Trypanosoma rangeli TaxID=5698 RepID=A0A3R7N908_TRYRA|nr:trans-sialidase [Trypanosoma rangeli]RNE98780.1 trans-sialidase [Trypanosoma rangeli]|eukprot:RNE98780.1 trans-sialidase [Trypanosoma rangeli]